MDGNKIGDEGKGSGEKADRWTESMLALVSSAPFRGINVVATAHRSTKENSKI